MPGLKLQNIHIESTDLDLLNEELSLGSFDVIRELEEAARSRLRELLREAKEG